MPGFMMVFEVFGINGELYYKKHNLLMINGLKWYYKVIEKYLNKKFKMN